MFRSIARQARRLSARGKTPPPDTEDPADPAKEIEALKRRVRTAQLTKLAEVLRAKASPEARLARALLAAETAGDLDAPKVSEILAQYKKDAAVQALLAK